MRIRSKMSVESSITDRVTYILEEMDYIVLGSLQLTIDQSVAQERKGEAAGPPEGPEARLPGSAAPA